MARGKPAKTLVIKVPRHGAQRIGLKFSLSVENLVRKEYAPKSAKQRPRVRYQHNNDPPAGALAQSIVGSSPKRARHGTNGVNFDCRMLPQNGIRC